MYVRNVKQVLRATDAGFDERRYGFNGLIDLLRACQREGLVRLERDRRGGLRVFQGPSLQQQRPSAAEPLDSGTEALTQPSEASPGEQVFMPETIEIEPPAAETSGSEHLEASPAEEQPQAADRPKGARRGRGSRGAKPSAERHPKASGERETKQPSGERGARKTGARKAAGAPRRASTRTRRTAASDNTDDSSGS
jgi:hypothetical protein